MKEVIENILREIAINHKQINFDSSATRKFLAEFIADKLNDNSDDCCDNDCGCNTDK